MVVEGSDGEVRVAFDACDVCGGYKGYRQSGTDVICNNCGRSFKLMNSAVQIPRVVDAGRAI